MHRLKRILSERNKNLLCYRYCSSNKKAIKEEKVVHVKYTDTINLPKTKFPQRVNKQKLGELQKDINEVRPIDYFDN